MAINRLLAAMEEYLSLRKEVGISVDFDEVKQASKRVELALKEYLQYYFDRAILEDRRKTSSLTTKVDVLSPEQAVYSWNDIAKLLDALNSAPIPMRDTSDDNSIRHWMAIYSEWFRNKKRLDVKPVKRELDLDFDDLKLK